MASLDPGHEALQPDESGGASEAVDTNMRIISKRICLTYVLHV